MGTATAYRYNYGKLVEEPDGPVVPGFGHAPTRIAPELDDRVLSCCHPEGLMGRTSTRILVHESFHGRGAFFLWPTRNSHGKAFMILGRLRPRPEAGEGQPGRTYTQLSSFAFPAEDWTEHAPAIIARAPDWLKAEPDLQHEIDPAAPRKNATPLVLDGLEESAFDDADALPDPAAPEWRLLACLERAGKALILGPSEEIPDEQAFCRLLGRALDLLPPSLRMLVTACVGFAEERPEFAIQIIPDASPLGAAAALGCLYQLRDLSKVRTYREWLPLVEERIAAVESGLSEEPPWSSPEDARAHLARILGRLRREQLVVAFQRYLDGDLPQCPDLPEEDEEDAGDARAKLILASARCIGRGVKKGEPSPALARATEAVANRMNGQAWTHAWAEAAKRDGGTRIWVQRISALRSSPDWDDPATGVGPIDSFRTLRRILDLQRLLATYHESAGEPDPQLLRHQGLNRRLKALIARAEARLVDAPEDIVDLAEVFPKAFAGVQPPARERLRTTLAHIAAAGRLLAEYAEDDRARYRAIAEAAEKVIESSFDSESQVENALPVLKQACHAALADFFDYYLTAATNAGKDEQGHAEFWRQAVLHTTLEADEGADFPSCVRELFRIVSAREERLQHEISDSAWTGKAALVDFDHLSDSMKPLFDEIFTELRSRAQDKTEFVSDHVRAICVLGDLRVAACEDRRLLAAFANCYQSSLWIALREANGDGLAKRVLPEAIKVLELATGKGVFEAARNFGLSLGEHVLQRLLDAGWTNRDQALKMVAQIESAFAALPGIAGQGSSRVDHDGAIVRRRDAREQRQKELSALLFELILSWVEEPEPRPWLEPLDPTFFNTQPIRLYLARHVGFPCSVYLGCLTHWPNDNAIRDKVPVGPCGLRGLRAEPGSLTQTDDPRRKLLIALCAVATWRERYKNGFPVIRKSIGDLLKEESGKHALDAVIQAVESGDDRVLKAIGADVVFLVDFFASLAPDGGARLHRETPGDIRNALMDPNLEVAITTRCFALFLASQIMVHGCRLGDPLLKLLSPGNTNAVNTRLLVADGGWDGLDDESMMWRLDRVLIAMDMIRIQEAGETVGVQTIRIVIGQDEASALELDDRHRPRVERFFRGYPDYRDAFSRSISKAHLDRLEGWPVKGQKHPDA